MKTLATLVAFAALAFLGCTEADDNATSDPVTITEETTTTLNETPGQKNAREEAASYLEFTSFSRSGLIHQLEYEGYTTEDATYGVDAQGADWNEQAAKEAASYLESQQFSHIGLVDQLVYEGFTPEEAEYGVSTTGL
jgi:nitrous oxide reductase accessory protein NosL